MAASKLKNRRRFITRDGRLDIPEDQEFTISPVDVTTSQHNSRLFAPYSITDDNSFYDRTWPRRTWRPANDFVKTFGGLHQTNSMVNSTLTLPRFHHGANNNYESQSRSGLQPQPPGEWNGNENNTSPSSPSDARWRFRSLSDVVSSSCLSAASSPSETVSEPCFKTNCHDSAVVYDPGSLSSRNSNVSSPRDLATTFTLRSIPELSGDDDMSISGLEAKRRSHSLNESSFYRPFFNQLRTNRSPQPGSVLHRALTWEMAGKSQPFRVTVSPISDPKDQECGFRRNASAGKLHVVQTRHALEDPYNVRSSSGAWKSVDPANVSWTKQGEGTKVSSSSAWNTVDPETMSRMKTGEGTVVSSSSAWKSVNPTTKSWSAQGEGTPISSSSAWNTVDPETMSRMKTGEATIVSSSGAWKSVDPTTKSWAEPGAFSTVSVSSAWQSVDPTTKSWSVQKEGTTISSSSAWKSVGPTTKSWAELGEGTTASASSAWKRVDPVTKSWTTHEDRMAAFDQDRAAARLSPSSTNLKDSWDEPRIKQTTWNSVSDGKQTEETREIISKNLSNGFDLGRLEQNATGGEYDGFRATEFRCSSARLSPVKTNRSVSGSTQSRNENANAFDTPSNTFRNSQTNDLDSSYDFLRTPLTQKTFKDELCRDDINFGKTYGDDFHDQSTSAAAARKPFRSKSLKLLSSESNSFTVGKDTGFLRPLSDWKSDTISLSTPTSPLSPPTGVETSPKPSVTHLLAHSCQSMVALNAESDELGLCINSLTRSATNLLTGSGAGPEKSLSTWGPFVVKDLRKAIMRPVATTSISQQIKPDSIVKPFGSNFVVRRITNLAKNPFNPISAIGEDENVGIKPALTTKNLTDETSDFINSLKATQLEKETNPNHNPVGIRLDLEKTKQDPIGMTLAYNDHDICARDKSHVPWSGSPAWNETPKTKLDEVCSPSICDSLTSSKDTGYERSATESSPTVTSERLTIHLLETRSPSLMDEDRLADRCISSSTLSRGNSNNSTNAEPCSRHIRVFLKSSSQLQDEATSASHTDEVVARAAADGNIDATWKKEVSKIQLDKSPSGDRWIEVGDETYAKWKDPTKVKDSAKVKDSVIGKDSAKVKDWPIVQDSTKAKDSLTVKYSSKVNDSVIVQDSPKVQDSAKVNDSVIVKYLSKVKDSAKLKDSACLAVEHSPKATNAEHWHPKSKSNENPTMVENVGNRFEADLRRPNEVPPALFDLDLRTVSTARPAASSKCHVEMRRNSDTGLLRRKPFEIVKKKLIIPEAMSWFGSVDNKSKPSLKQETTSEKEKDLLIRKARDDHGFRNDDKSVGVKVLSTVRKETNASRMNALVADAVDHKSKQSAEGVAIPCIKNDPSQTDAMTSCDRPVHVLDNITIVQSNQAVTFDTGISIISDGIALDIDNTNNNDGAVTLGDVSELGLEKSSNVFQEDVVYKAADDVLRFLNGWTDAAEGGKKYETTATNFLSNGKAPLLDNPASQVSSSSIMDVDEEEEQAEDFQANIDCSIMTELDQAIEMLTATRALRNKAPSTGSHISPAGTTNGPVSSQDGSLTPWEGISRKLTQAFSAEQVNRKIPTCPTVPPVQDKVRTSVSTVFNYFDPKPAVSLASFQGSCKPIAPIQVLRLSQKDVEVRASAATDKRNQWMMFQAREDSFNRPDSPLFRKTLPLPKDSVIMRHRLHQKEHLGSSGGGGSGSLSSSESSDAESPAVPRVAPRRAKKLRSMSVDRGVVGIERAAEEQEEEEDEKRNGERDSIASSTTSLRPVSIDSSFLSEDNM